MKEKGGIAINVCQEAEASDCSQIQKECGGGKRRGVCLGGQRDGWWVE